MSKKAMMELAIALRDDYLSEAAHISAIRSAVLNDSGADKISSEEYDIIMSYLDKLSERNLRLSYLSDRLRVLAAVPVTGSMARKTHHPAGPLTDDEKTEIKMTAAYQRLTDDGCPI